MSIVYWQKLILRGFGLFENEVSIDFTEGLNLLLSGNETGKTTLVVGLAAILFGLDREEKSPYSTKRFYNWNQPERFEGELFFLVDEQHYHLQRLFAANRARLRRWQGNGWQLICEEGGDVVGDASQLNLRIELRKLLGLSNRDIFLDTFCLSQLESDRFDFSAELKALLAGGARYPEALEILRQKADQCEAKDILLSEEQGLLKLGIERQGLQEDHFLKTQAQLEELQEDMRRNKRRLERLEELREPMKRWQDFADRIQVLQGKAAALERTREESRAQLAEIRREQGNLEKRCRELGLSVEQLEQRLTAMQQELDSCIRAEEEYTRARRNLQRYGPLPLPDTELIPLLERRLALLKHRALLYSEMPSRGLTTSAAVGLASLSGLVLGAIVFASWGRQHQLLGLLLSVILACALAIAVFRALPRGPAMAVERPKGAADLEEELRQQGSVLGALGLMDAVALTGCLTSLQSFRSLGADHPEPGARQHLEGQLEQTELQFASCREHIEALETLRGRQMELLTAQGVSTPEELDAALQKAQRETDSTLSAWRKLCLKYAELPEVLGRDLGAMLHQFQILRNDYRELEDTYRRDEEREAELREALAKCSIAEEFNIAWGAERLNQLNRERQRLTGERERLDLAAKLLRRSLESYTDEYRRELAERAMEYFHHSSGPREMQLILDADLHPCLLREKSLYNAVTLSQGTQDQLRFALRLALADHLSELNLLPLILDDPFANCDAQRRRRLGEIVQALAVKRQVWFLSHEESFASWGKLQVFHSLP